MDVMYLCIVGFVSVLGLLLIVKYRLKNKWQTKRMTVPGLDMTHPELGNFQEVAQAGSLHQFLVALHQKYGDIASYWSGKHLIVSISTPELFKQQSCGIELVMSFPMVCPVFTEDSIRYIDRPEDLHAAFARCFSESEMINYYPVIQANAKAAINDLADPSPDDHIPLSALMFTFAIETILQTVFGDTVFDNDAILKLQCSFIIVYLDLENQVQGNTLMHGTERLEQFQQECINIRNTLKAALQKAKKNLFDSPRPSKFLDVASKLDISIGERSTTMVISLVESFYTTGLLLTWALYYLASNPHVQQKAADEVKELNDLPSGPEAINKLVYLRQVIDETIRCSALNPYQIHDTHNECHLGGYSIPAGTPVMHALGVSCQDPRRWPQPHNFDPERFSPANRKKMPAAEFEPFGIAGNPIGFRFGLVESTIFLAGILRQFEVKLVPGQEVVPVYGPVAKPQDEIWVTFKKRA